MDPYVEAREKNFINYEYSLKWVLYGLDDPIWPLISVKGRYSKRKLTSFINKLTKPGTDEFSPYFFKPDLDYLYVLLRILTTPYEPSQADSDYANSQPFELDAICPPGMQYQVSFGNLIACAEDERILQMACVFYGKLKGEKADPEIVEFLREMSWLTAEVLDENSMSASDAERVEKAREEEAGEGERERKAPAAVPEQPALSGIGNQESLAMDLSDFPDDGLFTDHLVSFVHECMENTQYDHGHNLNQIKRATVFNRFGEKLEKLVKEYQKGRGATLFGNREAMIDINAYLLQARHAAEDYSGERA